MPVGAECGGFLGNTPHSYVALEDMFSGPALATRTPFDAVVALSADPQVPEARERLFELKFPDDIKKFSQMLPLVGFVCGSPLLEPEINIQRFYDIEPDQIRSSR